MTVIKRKKEETESPPQGDYVEIFVIHWQSFDNNTSEFMALRSFESFNDEILARAEHAIEAGRDYIENEAPGITPEKADEDEMETCTGGRLSDAIGLVRDGQKALAEKNGPLANEISNYLMSDLLEVGEVNNWYKAYLYLT